MLDPSGGPLKLDLVTACDPYLEAELKTKLNELRKGLSQNHIEFDYVLAENIHDRWIETDIGWRIILGRGLDIFQKLDDKFTLGFMDQTKRKCKTTSITYKQIAKTEWFRYIYNGGWLFIQALFIQLPRANAKPDQLGHICRALATVLSVQKLIFACEKQIKCILVLLAGKFFLSQEREQTSK